MVPFKCQNERKIYLKKHKTMFLFLPYILKIFSAAICLTSQENKYCKRRVLLQRKEHSTFSSSRYDLFSSYIIPSLFQAFGVLHLIQLFQAF